MSMWSYMRGTWGTWEWDIGLLRVEFGDFPGLRSGRKGGLSRGCMGSWGPVWGPEYLPGDVGRRLWVVGVAEMVFIYAKL